MNRLLALLLVPVVATAAVTPRRVLVATWAPDGGPGKQRLLHGRTDAGDLARAFVELGGVATDDLILSEASDTGSLARIWREADSAVERAKSQGIPTELIVFHTGHADAEGLQLGSEKLPWDRLRSLLSHEQGGLRVAFLDACASGSALRSKGGRFHPAQPSPTVTGRAVLASSRSDELSTESDKDGGSLFTRSLVSGLRGAADQDKDGRVTLSEAFRHSSRETERRAKELGAPSQHPDGSTELVGSVDPVLTDVRNPPARLRLEPGFPALSLRDSSRKVIGTASTGTRDTLDLALTPGLWTLEEDSGRRQMRVLLRPGETRMVSPLELLAKAPTPISPLSDSDTATTWVPINFGILPPVSLNGGAPRKVRNAFSMDLILGEAKLLTGFQFALVMSRVFGDAKGFQMSVGGNTVTGDMKGLQLSIANQVEGDFQGAQIGTDLNLIEGDLAGTQLGLLMNVARGTVHGTQIGIGANYAGILDHGVQLALVTVSGHAHGVQAGLVNVASRMDGVQAGLINVGSGSGARFGLLNVVPSGSPFAFGALSVGKELALHPSFQVTPDGENRICLHSRRGWFQSGMAWEGIPVPFLRGEQSLSVDAGVRFERILAAELGLAWTLVGDESGWPPQLVAGFAWPILSHLSPIVQASWSFESNRASIWSGVEF